MPTDTVRLKNSLGPDTAGRHILDGETALLVGHGREAARLDRDSRARQHVVARIAHRAGD